MTQGEPLPLPQADFVQVGEPVGAWSKLLASDAALQSKVAALQLAPSDGRDWMWRLIDCAVEHLQAEMEGLRQDALRWRAIRDKLGIRHYQHTDGTHWWIDTSVATVVGQLPETVEEAADRLASRSLPGALKTEKGP